MEAQMKERAKIIPLTFLERTNNLINDFFIYVRNSVILPPVFYYLYQICLIFQSCFNLLYAMNTDLWPPGRPGTEIARFIETVVRFGLIGENYSQFVIQEGVTYAIVLIAEFPAILSIATFKRVGRISTFFLYYNSFVMEFFNPLLFSTFPVVIGYLIGALIQGREVLDTVSLVFSLVVRILVWIIFNFLAHNYNYSQLAFYRGRTMFWSGQMTTFSRLSIDIIVILARIGEMNNGTSVIITLIINILFSSASFVLCFFQPPFFRSIFNAIHMALEAICIVIAVCNLIVSFGVWIDDSIRIFILFFFSVVLLFYFIYAVKKREKDDLYLLDLLLSKDIKFKSTFRTKIKFIRAMQSGIKNGHKYVLSWVPFEKALKKWPKDTSISIFYMRFVAIYVSQTTLLMKLRAEMKFIKNKSIYSRAIMTQIKKVLTQRNRHMSKELKASFKIIDDKVKQTKALLVSYWNAIIENSNSSAYNMAHQLAHDFEERDCDFQHIINMSPNSPAVSQKYSQFLGNIVCDPIEATHWEERAQFLKHQKQIIFDHNQMYALSAFPRLPRDYSTNEEHASATLTMMTDEHSRSSRVSTTTNNILDFDDKFVDPTPSVIRNAGREAPVGFIKILYIIAIIFFISAFFCTPFLPSFIMMAGTNSVMQNIEPIAVISQIYSHLSVLNSMFMSDGVKHFNKMPTPENVATILGITGKQPDIPDMINQSIHAVNSLVQEAAIQFHQKIDVESDASKIEFNSNFQLGSLTNPYNATCFEGLNILASDAFKYSPTENPMLQDWFYNFINNSDAEYGILQELMIVLSAEMPQIIKKYNDDSQIAAYLLIIVSILIFILYVFRVLKIRREWNYIIKTISSVPRVAIQNFLSMQTQKQDEELSRAELKYSSVFTQMIASRESSNGLPIGSLIRIGVANLIFAAVLVVVITVIVGKLSPTISSTGIKIYHLNNLLHFYFATNSMILTTKFPKSGSSIDYQTIIAPLEALRVSLNNFLFSQYQGQQSNYLTANKLITQTLLNKVESDDLWSDETFLYNKFTKMPRIIALDTMVELLDSVLDENITNPGFDPNVLLAIFGLYYHIYPVVLTPIIVYSNSNKDTLEDLITSLFSISAVLLVIGIGLISWLIYVLHQVEVTVKFCLSSLSMLKPQYIKDSKNIMELLSGNFEIAIIHNHSLDGPLEKVTEIINELIIVVDKQMRIMSINDAATDLLSVNFEDWKKAHLSLLIEFRDPSIMPIIEQMTNGNEPQQHQIEGLSPITIPSNQKTFEFQISLWRIDHSLNDACVIVLRDIHEIVEKRLELKELIDKVDQFRLHVIPKPLRDKYDPESSSFKLINHNVFIAVIKLCGFTDMIKDQNSTIAFKEVLNFINALKIQSSKSTDAIIVKHIGCSVITLFNMRRQTSNSYEVANNMLQFCTTFTSNNPRFKIKVGFELTKNLSLALRSEKSLQLEAYSRSISRAFSLAHQAEEGNVIMGQNIFDYLPITTAEHVRQIQVIVENQVLWGRTLDLEEFNKTHTNFMATFLTPLTKAQPQTPRKENTTTTTTDNINSPLLAETESNINESIEITGTSAVAFETQQTNPNEELNANDSEATILTPTNTDP